MDDEYAMRQRRRSWRTILLPVMGFLLAGLAAIIAFVASDPVTELVQDSVRGVPEGDGLQIAIGFGIFIILMLIFAAIYAVFAPKPKIQVSERELEKERRETEREKVAQRKRRRQINREMARQNRDRNT